MSKVMSFVRLDFYTIKPYTKSYLLMLAMSVGMGIAFKSLVTLSSYFMMCLVLSLSYPFSIGEVNRMDTLYATLSLNRRKMVAGRYTFAICMELLAILLVLLIGIAISFLGFISFSASELMVSLCVTSLIFCLLLSVQYPIYFKLGYNKAKFIAYVPLFLGAIAVIMIISLVKKIGVDEKAIEDFFMLYTDTWGLLFALPVVGHLLIILSYKVSCRFYENRDI